MYPPQSYFIYNFNFFLIINLKMNTILFFYLVIIFIISNSSSIFLKKPQTIVTNSKNFTVIGVFEVIRHGARTPLPKGNTNNFYIGTMNSQLTINGLRQHLLLGRWIRERYIDGTAYKLFEENFDEMNLEEVEIISSHRQRSIFSSASHILGMFPKAIIKLKLEGHVEIKNNDIPPIKNFDHDSRDGREIMITVLNGRKDNMFKAAYCKLQDEKENLIKSLRNNKTNIFLITKNEKIKAIDEILNNYKDVLGVDGIDLNKEKYSDKTFRHIISFLRPFKYHYVRKLNLSKSSHDTIAKFVLNKFYNIRLKDTVKLRLMVSNIFDTLSNFFVNRINNKTIKRFYLLSGFDNTIADIISNLLSPDYLKEKIYEAVNNIDTFNFLVPPVASSVIFELLKDERNLNYVRIIYNGKVVNGKFLKPLNVVDNEFIEFDGFINLVKSRIVKDYDELKCDIDN